MKVRKMDISVEGELEGIPNVAGIIQACVKMNAEGGRETGDLYFESLRVTYTYSEHERGFKKGGRKKKDADNE